MGFTHFSQLHPGSKYPLPMLVFPTFAVSTFPLSNERVSAGEVKIAYKSQITKIHEDLSNKVFSGEQHLVYD